MLKDRREALHAAIVTAIFIVLMGAIVWHFSTRLAHAGWRPEYALLDESVQQWFSTRRNARGQSCCSEADGHRYYGDYTIHSDGSVTADGEDIPTDKVLSGPNPTGAAVWWFLESGGKRTTYCFAPGGGA